MMKFTRSPSGRYAMFWRLRGEERYDRKWDVWPVNDGYSLNFVMDTYILYEDEDQQVIIPYELLEDEEEDVKT